VVVHHFVEFFPHDCAAGAAKDIANE